MKTHVLALAAAIRQAKDDDYYVSDLWHLFNAIRTRSRHDPDIWKTSLDEYPTPFAFLLYEISHDLELLSREAIQNGVNHNPLNFQAGLVRMLHGLSMSWSFCVWDIAKSDGKVSKKFKEARIREYLNFTLQLGFGTSEILRPGQQVASGALDFWRGVWITKLKQRFVGKGDRARRGLTAALEGLDRGKSFVFDGETWLKSELADILIQD